ncbi:MAG: SurA N-terminal domain-containing protein [Dysgonamonadaceae bacterium]|jgi:peptidyl-prolyl cis-trans isomerase D|nr:SurA N-terminal domain-containing protein [Dysgonamonadaceae bacterium]
MATLQKIRNQAGLLVGIVGLALLAFILGDGLNSFSTFFKQRKETILIVDNQSIGVQDFQAKVAEMEEIQKTLSGNSSLPEEAHAQIRESVFEMMVRDILLGELSLKVGFTVSREELKDLLMGDNISPMIQQMPMFRNPQTGAFDKNALIQFLQVIESEDHANQPDVKAARIYWLFIEQAVKQQRLEDKFTTLITKAVVANSLDAKAAFEASNTSVDFDFAAQSYATIADDQVTVSEAEIQKLYNRRKEQFRQSEAVLIDYISVDIAPSQYDFAKIEDNLNNVKLTLESSTNVADIINAVNDNSDVPFTDVFISVSRMPVEMKNFVSESSVGSVSNPILVNSTFHLFKLMDKTTAPDSIKVNQIPLPQLDEQALTHLTDSLINVINKGKSFTELATELSEGRSNGEMGWLTEADLLNASDEKFKNTVFNAPLKKVFVATSTYGSHLVQVAERTAPVAKYKVANVQVTVTPSSDTFKNLYNGLAQFLAKNKTLEAFRTAAPEAGFIINSDVPVGRNDQAIGAIQNVRPIIRWAYDQRKGAISDNIFECQNKFVIAAVAGFQKEGVRPLADVVEMLKRELLNEKKAEKIIANLKEKQFDSLEQYAEAMSSSVQSVQFVNFATNRITGIGVEPVVTANAPLTEVGTITRPLQGLNAVFVLKVTNKNESDAEFNLQVQRMMLEGTNAYRFRYQAMQTLREKSNIVDERIRFY